MTTYEPPPGCEIREAIREAIQLATDTDTMVEMTFNGVRCELHRLSDAALIHRDWGLAMEGVFPLGVGPFPAPTHSPEVAEHISKARAENARREQARAKERAEKTLAKESKLAEMLADAPPITLSDRQTWRKCVAANSEPYGAACVRYAENWARLMQSRIDAGCSLDDVAQELSHVADTEGITGFTYGAAISILSQCWTHGDALRAWHEGVEVSP